VEVAEESALIVWDAADKTQHFIRRASFNAEDDSFGFLVPTPTRPELAEASDKAFKMLEMLTAPPVRIAYIDVPRAANSHGRPVLRSAPLARPPVNVLEIKRVAGFDAAVLEATDAQALTDWLKKHDYQSRPELMQWLEPYVKQGWKITAFKIAQNQRKNSSIHTSAVRMSFKTDKPFFPYREPADQRTASHSSRLLRVYFLSEKRAQGSLGNDGVWPGKTVHSKKIMSFDQMDLLDLLKLAKPPLADLLWLTEFEDRATPRPGTDDVFFSMSADDSVLTRPEVIRYQYRYSPPKVSPVKPGPTVASKLAAPSRSPAVDVSALPDGKLAPPGLIEPAFQRRVDGDLVWKAWIEVNPSLMTDVALQLAEAESVLGKQNSPVSAAKLLSLAASLGAERRDQPTLARLMKAAERTGDKALAAEVRAAQKLAGAARSLEPKLPSGELTPEETMILQAHHRAILQAKLAGRQDILAGLARGVDSVRDLPASYRARLKTLIEDAIKADLTPNPAAQVLEWLANES